MCKVKVTCSNVQSGQMKCEPWCAFPKHNRRYRAQRRPDIPVHMHTHVAFMQRTGQCLFPDPTRCSAIATMPQHLRRSCSMILLHEPVLGFQTCIALLLLLPSKCFCTSDDSARNHNSTGKVGMALQQVGSRNKHQTI